MKILYYLYFFIIFCALFLFSSTTITKKLKKIKNLLTELDIKNQVFSKLLDEKEKILTSEMGLDILERNKIKGRLHYLNKTVNPFIYDIEEDDNERVPSRQFSLKCLIDQNKKNEEINQNQAVFSASEMITKIRLNEILSYDIQDQVRRILFWHIFECSDYEYSFKKNQINGDKYLNIIYLHNDDGDYPTNIYILNSFQEKEVSNACFKEIFQFKTIPSNVVCDKYTCSYYVLKKWDSIDKKLKNRDRAILVDNAEKYYILTKDYVKSIKEKLSEKSFSGGHVFSIQNQAKLNEITEKIKEVALRKTEWTLHGRSKFGADILEHFRTYYNETFNYIENMKLKPVISWQDDENFESVIMNLYNLIESTCEKLLTKNRSLERKNYLTLECCPNKAIEEIENIISSSLVKPVLVPGISSIIACSGFDIFDMDFTKQKFYKELNENEKIDIQRENEKSIRSFIRNPLLKTVPHTRFLKNIHDIEEYVKNYIEMPEKIIIVEK